MPTITLTLPVAGQNILAGLHSTNFANLQTLLNGGLDNTNIAAAGDIQGSKIRQSYGTTPPGSPSTGDIWVFPADATNGVNWVFRYNAGSASAYKWECIGGPQATASVATDETTASTGAWVNLATNGPLITVPRAGDYEVFASADMYHSASSAFISAGVSNGDTSATISLFKDLASSGASAVVMNFGKFTGIAASDVLKIRYKMDTAGTGHWRSRLIGVRPIRVS